MLPSASTLADRLPGSRRGRAWLLLSAGAILLVVTGLLGAGDRRDQASAAVDEVLQQPLTPPPALLPASPPASGPGPAPGSGSGPPGPSSGPPPAQPDADLSPDPTAVPQRPASAPVPAFAAPQDLLAPFRGLSTWIDLYDTDQPPRDQVASAVAGGAQLLYVQSARFNSPTDLHDHARLGEVIEAAHDAGLQVLVWYLPDFLDLERDLRRSRAAIGFVSPRGDRPDAFGLDIESELLPDPAQRSRRLLALASAVRSSTDAIGGMPSAAIVLPPLQLDLRPAWWPEFPYAALRPSFDAYIPMSYSSFRGTDAETTYGWNARNVSELRARTGDPALPVHLAGGIADRLPAVEAFVRAAIDTGVIGAGLYDLRTTPATAWPTLATLRAP